MFHEVVYSTVLPAVVYSTELPTVVKSTVLPAVVYSAVIPAVVYSAVLPAVVYSAVLPAVHCTLQQCYLEECYNSREPQLFSVHFAECQRSPSGTWTVDNMTYHVQNSPMTVDTSSRQNSHHITLLD